jgi:hypothetical protein
MKERTGKIIYITVIVILFIFLLGLCAFGNDFRCCDNKKHTNICKIKTEHHTRQVYRQYRDKPNAYYHDPHGHELARTYIPTYRGRYRVVHRRIETHDENGRALY